MDDGLRGSATCIDEDTLASFAEGHAAASVQARVERHVAECSDCRAVLAGVATAGYLRIDGAGAVGLDTGETLNPDLAPGTRVGRYIVERLIGIGAMGAVYAARDPDLDRIVALKLLRAGALSEAERTHMRARLLREAKAMARLSHPEVITLYDVGALGDQLFVAMEHVDGGTLRQWRSERHRSCADILAVYERAGSGLAAAHDAGLVHRDVKPDNVLIGRDGRVRVTDFGLARARAEPAASGKGVADSVGAPSRAMILTGTGALLGTPAYMAPEQLRGRPADARSDVFGFCVALYEALYGERPFAGRTILALRQAIERSQVRSAPLMTRVPGWVRATLLRGLRASPDDRFLSMRELLDALRDGRARSRRRVLAFGATSLLVVVPALATFLARNELRADAAGRERAIALPGAGGSATALPTPLAVTVSPAPSSQLESAAGPADSTQKTERWVAPKAPRSVLRGEPSPSPLPSSRGPLVGSNGAFILE